MNTLLFAAANGFMKMFTNTPLSAEDTTTPPTYDETKWGWVKEVTNAIDIVLMPLLVIVATAGTIYAIVLGVNLARAESADKQKEAKQRMINFVIAFVITIALILLMKLIATYLPGWLGGGTLPEPAKPVA